MDSPRYVLYSEFTGTEAPFQDHVDIRHDLENRASGRMVLDIRKLHTNSGKVLHGGMVMTLLDIAMSTAARHQDAQSRVAVTVELKVNFLRPCGCAGEQVDAHGFVRHATRTLAFCDGELRNEAGEVLATASGTFRFIRRAPADAPALTQE